MELGDLSIFKLLPDSTIKPFDCEDGDLNSFLIHKAKDYSKQLLATTYVIENEDRTIAYFSIYNDSLRIDDLNLESKTSKLKWLQKFLPHKKRHLTHYPALKIGRLGVCKTSKKCGLGKQIVQYIINTALESNSIVACKLITVDAYDQSLGFYEKMNFKYFSEKDAGEDTRQMYFDLTPLINIDEELQA